MKRSGEAIMNGNGTKNATTHCHAVQGCDNNFSVVSGAVSELKRLSVSPGNSVNEKLFFLTSSLSNPYESTLNFPSGSNQKQNDNALCGPSLLLHLTRASVRFHAKMEITNRAEARDITVSTLISTIEFEIQNSRSAPTQGTDNAKSAVAVLVISTSSGSNLGSNWSSAPCFSSPSAEISPNIAGFSDVDGFECSVIDWLEDLQHADDYQTCKQCDSKMILKLIDKVFPNTRGDRN